MSGFQIDTETVSANQQFDMWHAAMETVIDVARVDTRDGPPGFPAVLNAWDFAGVGLVSMRMPGLGYARRWTQVRQPAVDHWSLMLPIADGWRQPYAPRTLYVSSLGMPFSGQGSDTDVISLFIPRDAVSVQLASTLDSIHEPIVESGSAGLLMDLLSSLRGRLFDGLSIDPLAVRKTLLALISATVSPLARHPENAREVQRFLMNQRILREIRSSVQAPDLGIDMLCSTFRLSRSALYRIFPDQGVEAVIQKERLNAIAEVLVTNDQEKIGAIAARYGFYDPSTFSRAFKSCFGVSPSEYRVANHARPRHVGELDKFLAELDR
ncbi:helix-turn-helix domain-containing protein [Kaistia sp. MMO-174]|uniref:helix-turn-helix domain-containing protein n=1 Tax=Kaistia sp. MMO-174 TaxID=3081256 RepID=UPI00301B2E68